MNSRAKTVGWNLIKISQVPHGTSREKGESFKKCTELTGSSQEQDAKSCCVKNCATRIFLLLYKAQHTLPKSDLSHLYHNNLEKSILYLLNSSETDLITNLLQPNWRNRDSGGSSRCEICFKGIWTVIKYEDGESWIRAISTQSLDHRVNKFWF